MNKFFVIVFIFFFKYHAFGQSQHIQVLSKEEIGYYNVYKVIDYVNKNNDTLIMIGCKSNNKDFKEINLGVGKRYKIKSRLNSQIKISDEKYIFCSPGVNVISEIPISLKGSLPVLILDYEMICKD